MIENASFVKDIGRYGSTEISGGRLTGTTDTDYFYFLCPDCAGGGKQIMRIIRYYVVSEGPFRYKDLVPKVAQEFILGFQLYCPECKLRNVVKISNGTRQGGLMKELPT